MALKFLWCRGLLWPCPGFWSRVVWTWILAFPVITLYIYAGILICLCACPKCRTAYPLLGGLARNALVFDTVHCNSVLFQMFITLCSSIIHVTQINYYVPRMVLIKFRNDYTSLANNKHSDGSCYSPVV